MPNRFIDIVRTGMSAGMRSAMPSAGRRGWPAVGRPLDDYQRQPAASVMDMDARSAMARVKRARFDFTINSS
jgi:hypothetical protein